MVVTRSWRGLCALQSSPPYGHKAFWLGITMSFRLTPTLVFCLGKNGAVPNFQANYHFANWSRVWAFSIQRAERTRG